jgi:hypothetical protein
MPTTIEATIDEKGIVLLQVPIQLSAKRRALVVILDEAPTSPISETALLSELSLAQDWNRPEEDEAWSHLQYEQSS